MQRALAMDPAASVVWRISGMYPMANIAGISRTLGYNAHISRVYLVYSSGSAQGGSFIA